MSEFIAEAQVLITPSVATFAATLRAEVEAAVRGVGAITIPVTPVVAKTGGVAAQAAALTAANTELAASNQGVALTAEEAAVVERELGAQLTKTATAEQGKTAANRAATESNRQLALSNRAIAAGERQVLATSSEIAAARVRLNAASRSLTRAEEALSLAYQSQNPVLIANRIEHATLAAEYQASTVAAFQLAEANAGLASQEAREAAAARAATVAQERRTAGLAKGAASTALSAIGARGATLAASGPFLAGAAATVGVLASLKAASDLDVQLNVLRVTAEATGAEMEAVSEQARALGTDISLPGVSAIDAATAMTELSKAGLDVQNSIEGARGVLQLATAAGIDNAAATELAASALNAFGLAGDQATHVADVFANAANESQGSIVDIGTAFQQAAAVARLAGVSFEDTAALLTILARNGLQGSDAGTSLRTAFIRLINPTKEAAELLRRMNITIRDVNGNVRPEVFAEFSDATRNLTRSQQDAATAIVFGQDAIRAAAIAGREGIAAMNETREALDRQGAAAEQAAARNTGLRGALENLKNQAVDLGISVGEGASGPTEEFVNILAGGIKNINDAAKALDALQNGTDESGTAAEKAAKQYQELVVQLGVISQSLALRRGEGFDETSKTVTTLREEQEKLLKSLGEITSEGIGARDAVEGYGAANRATRDAAEGLNNRLDESVDRFKSIAREIDSVTGKVKPTIAALSDLDLAVAQAGGNQGAEIGILRQRETRQDTFLNRVLKREQTPKNVALAKEAARNLKSTRDAITTIEEGNARDAEQAANEQARIREDAAREQARIRTASDQKVIDAIARGRRPLDLRQITADDSERLDDNIKLARDRKKFLQDTINIVRTSIKDDKLREDTIAALVEERARLTVQIGNDLAAMVDDGRDAFEANLAQAEASGNINRIIAVIDKRTAELQKVVAAAKTSAKARKAARDEIASLSEQREETENRGIQERIALGQSILDLTGNKNPLLKAFDAAIVETQKDIDAAKRLGKSTTVLQTELNNFLKQRKEVLDEAKKDSDATSAFDLLTGAAETFRATGGNLIGGNQPFAGPTGFTADLAQFLRRQQPQAVRVDTTDVAGRAIERQISATEALTAALERNTDAQAGNTPAGVPGSPGSLRDRWNQQRYNYNPAQARKIVEGRIVR